MSFNTDAFSAQTYPIKPIRVITAEPGGGTELVARFIAQELTAALNQPVVVESRGGASGIIAAQTVAKAPPDGYTLLIYSGNLWILPFLKDNVPYDPVKDFSPITMAGSTPNVLVVHPLLPVKTAKELIALAKARPSELSYASGGAGSTPHLGGELFKAMAGINIVHVPYKSGGAGITGLIGGEVQVGFPDATLGMRHVKSGRLKGLAVTSAEPSALAPGLPTIAASGLRGYETGGTYGVFAPAATPEVVISRLNQEIVRLLGRPEVKERFFSSGVESAGSSPEQLVARVKSDMAKWSKVIRDAGIRAD